VGQLDDEGLSTNFHGDKWKVIFGARILAQGYKTGTLYMTTNIRDVAFEYRFWDEQNREIIKSRNVTFNENVVYKNDSSVKPARIESEAEKPEFINLDGIPKGTAARRRNSKNEEGLEVDDTVDQQTEQGTPTVAVSRSLRNVRPPERYSPSLFHILLTDGSEPETFVKALQVEDPIKWELSMKDEMDSLLTNQTWELTELSAGKKALNNKWVFRIKGADFTLKGYVNADLVGDVDSRKGTTGFVITLCGTAVSWASNLQKSVTIEKLKLSAASVGLRV